MSPSSPQDHDDRSGEREPTGPVIRDRRRLDPETGEVRGGTGPEQTTSDSDEEAIVSDDDQNTSAADEPDQSVIEGEDLAPESTDEVEQAVTEGDVHPDTQLAADRLLDLQRLQAEYVNYKKRVTRDRDVARDAGIGSVVEALLPVLDDLHSAREHGDLTDGPMAAIADKLESSLGRFGVERLGTVGEAFDPALHEALMHVPDADLPEGAESTTIVQVMQPGFRVGGRVVRPARVAVADPA